jgi:hypothetical protein
MRNLTLVVVIAIIGAMLLIPSAPSFGQARPSGQPECQALRDRLTEHAKLSDGVRRTIADRATR